MPNFVVQMKAKRDEDIVRIAKFGEEEGYEAEAVFAAVAELRTRNIPSSDLSQVVEDASLLKMVADNAHLEPLNWGGKIAFALFSPFLLPSILVAAIFAARGYKRKSRDAFVSIGTGFLIFYGGIALGDLLLG